MTNFLNESIFPKEINALISCYLEDKEGNYFRAYVKIQDGMYEHCSESYEDSTSGGKFTCPMNDTILRAWTQIPNALKLQR